jgi:hypothetical protein
MPDEFLSPEIEAYFPNLRRDLYRKTSEKSFRYNCIAHAAETDDAWWWPCDGVGIFWPTGIAKEETIGCFVKAYSTLGYLICAAQSRDVETGIEKVALYADENGVPTHVARQLPSGEWTSKLGREEDICHLTLEALGDQTDGSVGYGRVALILKRPKPW